MYTNQQLKRMVDNRIAHLESKLYTQPLTAQEQNRIQDMVLFYKYWSYRLSYY